MTKTFLYKISTQFSEFPAGRYPEDGPHNGESFRENVLAPLLQKYGKLTIDLDGTDGYGSSFLEEAFGGLIRHHDVTADTLRAQLSFIADDDDSFVDEIWGYIQDASK